MPVEGGPNPTIATTTSPKVHRTVPCGHRRLRCRCIHQDPLPLPEPREEGQKESQEGGHEGNPEEDQGEGREVGREGGRPVVLVEGPGQPPRLCLRGGRVGVVAGSVNRRDLPQPWVAPWRTCGRGVLRAPNEP